MSGLRVACNGELVYDEMKLQYYHPQSTWAFMVGASTSNYYDSHRLDNVRIHAGALVGERIEIRIEPVV